MKHKRQDTRYSQVSEQKQIALIGKMWIEMNGMLVKQLAIDFCTDVELVLNSKNIFTEYQCFEGRRIFQESECFLKIATFNGKLLVTGRKDIIQWMQEKYKFEDAAWFMDMKCLHELEAGLSRFGCRIGKAHPFYIATEKSYVNTKEYEIKIFIDNELEQFRGDKRFKEAFLFDNVPKDEIGIGAYKNGKILGMAGATSDSDIMWQIGINVMPEAEGLGIGTMLVTILKNEILNRGKLPFYGTSMSHIASQRVAINAGFIPAWSELYCESICEKK